MPALSTDTRGILAAALGPALDPVPVFAYAPASVPFPAVVVRPDAPYLEETRVGPALSYAVRLVVSCVAPSADNAGGLSTVEAMIDAVLAALPRGFGASQVTAPVATDFGPQGIAYVADVSVRAHAQSEG